jgi:hypothetical protein
MEGTAQGGEGINPRALRELFRIKAEKEAEGLAAVDVSMQ